MPIPILLIQIKLPNTQYARYVPEVTTLIKFDTQTRPTVRNLADKKSARPNGDGGTQNRHPEIRGGGEIPPAAQHRKQPEVQRRKRRESRRKRPRIRAVSAEKPRAGTNGEQRARRKISRNHTPRESAGVEKLGKAKASLRPRRRQYYIYKRAHRPPAFPQNKNFAQNPLKYAAARHAANVPKNRQPDPSQSPPLASPPT